MSDDVAGGLLEKVAADLMQRGLHVDIPAGEPPPGEADTSFISVRGAITGQYAEIALVRHGPGPDEAFLQLSYWTALGDDPDGLQMASRVRCLLAD
jgi:hypothetical protein